ncbi:MAG: DNA internalization-related competence protein ComEC/Rec2 [Gemmatimonadales bacterium]|nr:DNA internalization-related competence protein ComEC/Rec2 [Gemmatimonadales bacterium]
MTVIARVLEPVDSAGGVTVIAPRGAGCRGSTAAHWPPSSAVGAGSDVRVVGRWIRGDKRGGRPSGRWHVEEVLEVRYRPRPDQALRNAIVQTIAQLYGQRGPIVDALVLNRKAELDRSLRDRFARAGMVHLLAISGFHVGLVTAWAYAALRLLGLARGRSLAIASLGAVAYAAFLGWPAPATRAALLSMLVSMARLRQRRVDPGSLLAATGLLVLVVDPWAVLDAGAWLSVLAVWGITTFSRRTERLGGRLDGSIRRAFSSSFGATLATAPVTAALFGVVAVVGIGVNLVALPIAGAVVPGVLASLVLAPIAYPLAERLAGGAGLGLNLLEWLAEWGSRIPLGHIVQPAGPAAALPWVLILALGLWITGRRNTLAEVGRRSAWVLVLGTWAMLVSWLPRPFAADGALTLHFLDVGQGDGALIRTPGGRWVVVDGGPKNDRFDAGQRRIIPFLRRQRAESLEMVVVSHAHADHLGGVPAVLSHFPVGVALEPGLPVTDPLYQEFLGTLVRQGVPWRPARAGDRIDIDGVGLTILHPDTSWHGWGEDLNEDSIVLYLEFGEFEAILGGDAGRPVEALLEGRIGQIDLLKVGHHGSASSTGAGWVQELQPKAALVSVGRNTYGHPDPGALARLEGNGVSIWRTDRDGLVTVVTDGRTMEVRGKRRRAVFADLRDSKLPLQCGAGTDCLRPSQPARGVLPQ